MGMFRNLMASGTRRRDPLYGIHYVADWDGKGRSNEEEEPMRSTWTDKATGKVIDLHNYAFAGGSGWNGYAEDFLNWELGHTQIEVTSNSFTVLVSFGNHPAFYKTGGNSTSAMRIKVSGLTKGKIIYLYNDSELSFTIEQNGVYDLPESVSAPESTVKFASRFQFVNNSPNVTVEQLPLYPGALVSDGIDDYGVTRETISEKVGTMLAMLEINEDEIKTGSYFFNCGKNENANKLYCWLPSDGIPKMGLPSRNITLPIGVLTRTPASPSEVMYIAAYSGGSPSKVAIYRLILIQEQLDDAQVEFLKWKVEKEYRDWCKANGYEYAINQLTA